MLTVIALVEDLFGVGVEVVACARSAKALCILPVGQAASTPHQRVGALSNAHVGRDFEGVALEYFLGEGVELERDFPIELELSRSDRVC